MKTTGPEQTRALTEILLAYKKLLDAPQGWANQEAREQRLNDLMRTIRLTYERHRSTLL